MTLRPDLSLISEWIQPDSRVLDLGCGRGDLLSHLIEHKNVRGYGIEIEHELIAESVKKGINVIEADLDDSYGISQYFDAQSFDYVVMTQALQTMDRPDHLIDQMLRVGKQGIITFPNFGHWTVRLQLLFKGKMPETETLPYTWYNTPNIHMCSFKDFETLCQSKGIRILDRAVVNQQHRSSMFMSLLPNWAGEIAIYRFEKTEA